MFAVIHKTISTPIFSGTLEECESVLEQLNMLKSETAKKIQIGAMIVDIEKYTVQA